MYRRSLHEIGSSRSFGDGPRITEVCLRRRLDYHLGWRASSCFGIQRRGHVCPAAISIDSYRFISIPIQTKLQISHSQSIYGLRILLPGTLSWFVPGTFPKPLLISTYLSLFLPRGAAAKAPKRLDLGTLRERSSAARLKTTATSPAVQEQLGVWPSLTIQRIQRTSEDPEGIRGPKQYGKEMQCIKYIQIWELVDTA